MKMKTQTLKYITVSVLSISLAAICFADANDSNIQHFTAQETAKFEESMQSSFSGIGTGIEVNPKGLHITNIVPGSPAEKAGLKVGQIITEIDGKSTIGMTIPQAVSKIKGPTGSSVNLKLLFSDGTSKQMNIVRGTVKVLNVENRIVEPNIGLLKISSFINDTAAKAKEALLNFQQKNIKGLIVDLRYNPGGDTKELRKIGGMIVGPNEVICRFQKIGQNELEPTKSEGEKIAQWPIIVITNSATASSGELLASALKLKGGAKIIGQKTRGEITVYKFKKNNDGSSRKIRTGAYFTADGQPIQGKGVSPDIELDPNLPNDEVIKKAVNELTKEIKNK